jgi:hypothetical protein
MRDNDVIRKVVEHRIGEDLRSMGFIPFNEYYNSDHTDVFVRNLVIGSLNSRVNLGLFVSLYDSIINWTLYDAVEYRYLVTSKVLEEL